MRVPQVASLALDDPQVLAWGGVGLLVIGLFWLMRTPGRVREAQARAMRVRGFESTGAPGVTPSALTWEEAAPHLLLRIQLSDLLEQRSRLLASTAAYFGADVARRSSPLIAEPLVEGLAATLWIDMGSHRTPLPESQAERWRQTKASLLERARANLEALGERIELIPAENKDAAIWTLAEFPDSDVPAASLLLSRAARRRVTNWASGCMVVALANEERVALAAAHPAAALQFFAEFARVLFERAPEPRCTPRLLLWHEDGRLEWAPGA